MSGLITVWLDGESRRVPRGSRVRHLLDGRTLEQVRAGEVQVVDDKGRPRGLDGALAEGLHLALRTP